MKIIVSSLSFSKWLKSIGIAEDDSVDEVMFKNNEFIIVRGSKKDIFYAESKDQNCSVKQNNVRWDWLYRDLHGIQEQPIVIEFTDNQAEFTLRYRG